jgi:uncharacterized membrane protein
MWSRAEIKEQAKGVLRKRYWIPFIVSIIAGFLAGGNSGGGTGFSFSFSGSSPAIIKAQQSMSTGEFLFLISIFIVIFAVAFVFAMALLMFVSNPISVGKRRFYMENRQKETSIERMFFSFKSHYMNIVKVMFMQRLFIFLWSLLFVIPGIVKSYEYRMVPYILSENPDITWRRALELSREMTRNEKLEIFVLDLSFIGWSILGVMACCIGVVFLQPYIDATDAELYQKMREKAFSKEISTGEELPGFS